jgi:SOS-response transcriptional repressor LexA
MELRKQTWVNISQARHQHQGSIIATRCEDAVTIKKFVHKKYYRTLVVKKTINDKFT